MAISDRDHDALRLLSLHRNRKIISLIQEAIGQYLEREGAYELEITSTRADDAQPESNPE